MDPAAEVVKSHTLEVISDVLRRYDVDAIHFDDYFYPYPAADGSVIIFSLNLNYSFFKCIMSP
jgi:uncharacterized lipoprotein YddW (UPF0748 family)